MTAHRKATTLGLTLAAGLALAACGSRRDEDQATKDKSEAALRDEKTLVIAGENKSQDAVPVGTRCGVELKQSSVFDPALKDSPIRVLFQGRIDPSCLKDKDAEVFLASQSKLTLPGATCGPASGEFSIRCAGDIVRAQDDGHLELSFDAREGLEQLKTLRVKVRYN
jgi:hypothetical protein